MAWPELITVAAILLAALVGGWIGRSSAVKIERRRERRAESGARSLVFSEIIANYTAIVRLRQQLLEVETGPAEEDIRGVHHPTALYFAILSLDAERIRESAVDGFVRELPHAFDEHLLDQIMQFYEDARSISRGASRLGWQLPEATPASLMTQTRREDDKYRILEKVSVAVHEICHSCDKLIVDANLLLLDVVTVVNPTPSIPRNSRSHG